ncbi:ER membrane protein complex subunit 8/9-like protein [Abeliophyllum distichum]|uniref:ER membrane protein complex subunit 8/9-like protein n=1 Tax=Abeliophyllum distichum TaxID=126358 RepID=A0ABD1PTH5_9LAMI
MGGESLYDIHQNAYIKLVLHALKHGTSAVNAALIGRSSLAGDSVEIVDSVPLFHSQIGLLPPLEIALMMIEEYYGEKGMSIVGYFHANERSDDFELSSVAKNIGDHITRYFPQAALLLLENKKLEALPEGMGPESSYAGTAILGPSSFPMTWVLSSLLQGFEPFGHSCPLGMIPVFVEPNLPLIKFKSDKSFPCLVPSTNQSASLPSFTCHLYTKDASRSWKLVGSDGSNKLVIKEPSANIVLLDYISSEKWKDIIDFDDHLDDISKNWLNSELFQ